MRKSPSTSSRSQRHSRSDWKNIIKRFSESKLSIEQFCRQENILPVTLRKWERRFKSVNTPGSFVEVTPPVTIQKASVKSFSPSSQWEIELDLGQGMALRIRRS